jgi:hypothetical protein
MQTCSLQTIPLDNLSEADNFVALSRPKSSHPPSNSSGAVITVPSGLNNTTNTKKVLVSLIKSLQKEDLSDPAKQDILKVCQTCFFFCLKFFDDH